jgi:hypothetical protein
VVCCPPRLLRHDDAHRGAIPTRAGARHERPRGRRAAEQGEELASLRSGMGSPPEPAVPAYRRLRIRGRSFGRKRRRIASRSDNCHATADEVAHEGGQAIVLAAEPVVLNDHVLALDVTGFAEAFRERGCMARRTIERLLTKLITGIAGCCARVRLTLTASSKPPAPSSAMMTSRRFVSSMGGLPGRALRAPDHPDRRFSAPSACHR